MKLWSPKYFDSSTLIIIYNNKTNSIQVYSLNPIIFGAFNADCIISFTFIHKKISPIFNFF